MRINLKCERVAGDNGLTGVIHIKRGNFHVANILATNIKVITLQTAELQLAFNSEPDCLFCRSKWSRFYYCRSKTTAALFWGQKYPEIEMQDVLCGFNLCIDTQILIIKDVRKKEWFIMFLMSFKRFWKFFEGES